MDTLAYLTIASGVLSLLCLLILHVVSPEYQPSWRMVSEYALGKHKGMLTAFFFLWGISSLLAASMLWQILDTNWAKLGIVLLFVSGIGAIMGGLFDVKHPKHGMAFLLGVPTLPIAALLIGYNIISIENWSNHTTNILIASHATWISLVLMGVSMAVMFSGFKKSGVSWDKDAPPPEHVPDGVIALGGYANRILIACFAFFPILLASIYLSL